MKRKIKKWLTSAFLLLALASGVSAGTPLHSESARHPVMDCCKKAKSSEQMREASAARLCCALNCAADSSVPTSPEVFLNFSPSARFAASSYAAQIFRFLLAGEKSNAARGGSVRFDRRNTAVESRKILPGYLRHHSFLI